MHPYTHHLDIHITIHPYDHVPIHPCTHALMPHARTPIHHKTHALTHPRTHAPTHPYNHHTSMHHTITITHAHTHSCPHTHTPINPCIRTLIPRPDTGSRSSVCGGGATAACPYGVTIRTRRSHCGCMRRLCLCAVICGIWVLVTATAFPVRSGWQGLRANNSPP